MLVESAYEPGSRLKLAMPPGLCSDCATFINKLETCCLIMRFATGRAHENESE